MGSEASKGADIEHEAYVAVQVLLGDLLNELTRPEYQWVNAIVAAVIGIAALVDGRASAKFLVILFAGGVVFFTVLSQLHWTSNSGRYLRYVLALEFGAFTSVVVY